MCILQGSMCRRAVNDSNLKIARNLPLIVRNKCLTGSCYNFEVFSTRFAGETEKT